MLGHKDQLLAHTGIVYTQNHMPTAHLCYHCYVDDTQAYRGIMPSKTWIDVCKYGYVKLRKDRTGYLEAKPRLLV